jgi:gas vesicle protein
MLSKEGKTMENDNKQTGRVSKKPMVVAFFAGAVAGSIGALLLAPQSGRASREQLRGYARRTTDSLRDVADKAAQTWGTAKSKAREFWEEPQSMLNNGLKTDRKAMQQEVEAKVS